MFKFSTCFKVSTLKELIEFIKAFLVKGKAIISAALKLIFSAFFIVKYINDCSICLVAVLDAVAANFCNPTKESLAG